MNSLAAETSPYLLQHKDNPVHWQAWGGEAFAAAAAQDFFARCDHICPLKLRGKS